MKLTTTLNIIRSYVPCSGGWKRILQHLGKTKADDEPLHILTILESNGLDDTIWALRCWPEHSNTWRLYAVWCVSQVAHLLDDECSRNAMVVVERHARGQATDEELAAARDAARAAAWDAARAAAWDAARDAQTTELVRVIEALEAGVDPYPETIYTPAPGKEVAK